MLPRWSCAILDRSIIVPRRTQPQIECQHVRKKKKEKREAYHGGQSVRYAPPQLKRIAVAALLVNLCKVIRNPLALPRASEIIPVCA